MDIAYDIQLNKLVTATDASKSRKWHSSYKCPHCEREVVLIPASGQSGNRCSYFRHQKGSYAEDCEEYASRAYAYYTSHGNTFIGLSSTSDCKIAVSVNRENDSCFFSIDIIFSDAFLQQMRGRILSYAAMVSGRLIENLHQYEISSSNFVANAEWKNRLNAVGEELLVKIGTDEKKVPLFLKAVTFFDIAGNTDLYAKCGFIAKRVDNGIVFVGEEYIIVSKYDVSKATFPNVDFIPQGYYFGYHIIGVFVKEYSDVFAKFCHQFEYTLYSQKENIEILWPPTFQDKNNLITNEKQVYLYSSMELSRENNCYGETIKIADNLFRVDITENTKILFNEKIINIKQAKIKYQSIPEGSSYVIEEVCEREITMRQDGFWVHRDFPIKQLKKGQYVWLTNGSEIRLYTSNYLKTTIRPIQINSSFLDSKLTEILQNSKATVPLETVDLYYEGTDKALLKYIDQCRRNGKINPAVRKLFTKE